MKEEEVRLVTGMPTNERLREELAQIVVPPTKPFIYTGSVKLPCIDCGMELYVGPRSQEALKEAPGPVCPWCVAKRMTPGDTHVVRHLNNPEGNSP